MTSDFQHSNIPLIVRLLYCVLNSECPLREVPVYGRLQKKFPEFRKVFMNIREHFTNVHVHITS